MPTLSHVNQEREISISLFFAVKSKCDAPVFMPRGCHGNVINDSSRQRSIMSCRHVSFDSFLRLRRHACQAKNRAMPKKCLTRAGARINDCSS